MRPCLLRKLSRLCVAAVCIMSSLVPPACELAGLCSQLMCLPRAAWATAQHQPACQQCQCCNTGLHCPSLSSGRRSSAAHAQSVVYSNSVATAYNCNTQPQHLRHVYTAHAHMYMPSSSATQQEQTADLCGQVFLQPGARGYKQRHCQAPTEGCFSAAAACADLPADHRSHTAAAPPRTRL